MSWFTEFDPNPTWMIVTLQIISIFAGMVCLCGISCVIFVKRGKTDNRYRCLLIIGMTFNFLAQFGITTGSLPIVAFPLPAGYAAGFLSNFGVPTCAQLAIGTVLITSAGACTILLFFYRHHVLLPLPKYLTRMFLFCVFVGAFAIPPPLTASLCFTNRTIYKLKACEANPIECERMKEFLSDPKVDAMYFSEFNLHSCIAIYCLLLVLGMFGSIAIFVWRLIYQLKSMMISETTRKIHKVLVQSLLALTLVQYTFFLIPGCGIAACVMFSLPYPGIVQITEISYSLSDPAGVIAMIWCRKDYKSAIVSVLRRGGFFLFLHLIVMFLGLCCIKHHQRVSLSSFPNRAAGNSQLTRGTAFKVRNGSFSVVPKFLELLYLPDLVLSFKSAAHTYWIENTPCNAIKGDQKMH